MQFEQSPHPKKYNLSGNFFGGACKTPMQKFGHFLWVYAPSYRFTSVVSNTVEIGHDKFLKGRIVLVTEKKTKHTYWRRLMEHLG